MANWTRRHLVKAGLAFVSTALLLLHVDPSPEEAQCGGGGGSYDGGGGGGDCYEGFLDGDC